MLLISVLFHFALKWTAFGGTSTSIACISSVKANRGISSCLHLRTSKQKFPLNTESGCTQRALHAKTHSGMRTQTHIHTHTGAYSGHEGRGGFFFSRSISIYVNKSLVIVQKQPVVWWNDELSWLHEDRLWHTDTHTQCSFRQSFKIPYWFPSIVHIRADMNEMFDVRNHWCFLPTPCDFSTNGFIWFCVSKSRMGTGLWNLKQSHQNADEWVLFGTQTAFDWLTDILSVEETFYLHTCVTNKTH